MARKDLRKFFFPPEYEVEVVQLLETYGELSDPTALADFMGISAKALRSFLQSTKAQEAIARAHTNAKALLRPRLLLGTRLPSYGCALPEGCHEIQDVLPGSPVLHEVIRRKRDV